MNPYDKYSGDVLITLRENTSVTTDSTSTPTNIEFLLSNSNFGSLGTNIKIFLERTAGTVGSVEIENIEFDIQSDFASTSKVTYNASNYKTSIFANDRNSETEPFLQTRLTGVGKSAIAFSNLQNPGHKYFRATIKTIGCTGTYRVSAIVESSKDPVKQV